MDGQVACSWEIVENQFNLIINAPPNTYATATLPRAKLEEIQENGKSLQNGGGIINFFQDGDVVVLQLNSGNYHLVYKWKE